MNIFDLLGIGSGITNNTSTTTSSGALDQLAAAQVQTATRPRGPYLYMDPSTRQVTENYGWTGTLKSTVFCRDGGTK